MKKRVSKETKYSRKDNGGEKLSSEAIYIPLDLTVDILTKLPVKSLVRFGCVSKLWSSVITDSIKTRSLTHPRLLVILHHRLHSFSSYTYPLNTGRTFIAADRDWTGRVNCKWSVYGYVRGLICCYSSPDQLAIHNPTTRECVLLPIIKHVKATKSFHGFFGYDPVEDQYKVLSVIEGPGSDEYSSQVLTLGGRMKQGWRNVDNPDQPIRSSGVCINGIIYFIGGWGFANTVLERFDVRLERFDIIRMPNSLMHQEWPSLELVNYQGELGCTCYRYGRAEMWIMEDRIEKQEWSAFTLYTYPPDLSKTLGYSNRIAGVTLNGEIVILPKTLDSDQPFYAYFYDHTLYKTRRVELENTLSGELKYPMGVCVFGEPDHLENTLSLFGTQFNKKPATLRLVYEAAAAFFSNTKTSCVSSPCYDFCFLFLFFTTATIGIAFFM